MPGTSMYPTSPMSKQRITLLIQSFSIVPSSCNNQLLRPLRQPQLQSAMARLNPISLQCLRNSPNRILSDVCESPTVLFTNERPAIVTLCGLCWLFFRTDRKSEALRMFYKTVELQKRFLDKQFPMTAVSLEALSNIMPTGPVFWTPSGDERTLNNKSRPFGRMGTLKCSNCRRRKIRVDAFYALSQHY